MPVYRPFQRPQRLLRTARGLVPLRGLGQSWAKDSSTWHEGETVGFVRTGHRRAMPGALHVTGRGGLRLALPTRRSSSGARSAPGRGGGVHGFGKSEFDYVVPIQHKDWRWPGGIGQDDGTRDWRWPGGIGQIMSAPISPTTALLGIGVAFVGLSVLGGMLAERHSRTSLANNPRRRKRKRSRKNGRRGSRRRR